MIREELLLSLSFTQNKKVLVRDSPVLRLKTSYS